jgi:hypothetical protein
MVKKAKYVIAGIVVGILSVVMGVSILFQFIQYDKEVSRLDKFNNEYNEIFHNEVYDIKSISIIDVNKKIRLVSNKLNDTLAALPGKEESQNLISILKNISEVSGIVIDIINVETTEREFYDENLIAITLSGSKGSFNKFSKLDNSIAPVHSWGNCSAIADDAYPVNIYCNIATYYRKSDDFTNTISMHIAFPPKNTELWLPFLSSRIQEKISKANELKEDLAKYENEIRLFRTYMQMSQQLKYAEAILGVLLNDRKSFNEAYLQAK